MINQQWAIFYSKLEIHLIVQNILDKYFNCIYLENEKKKKKKNPKIHQSLNHSNSLKINQIKMILKLFHTYADFPMYLTDDGIEMCFWKIDNHKIKKIVLNRKSRKRESLIKWCVILLRYWILNKLYHGCLRWKCIFFNNYIWW